MFANRLHFVRLLVTSVLFALVAAGPAAAVTFTVATSNPTPSPGDVFIVTVSTDVLPANITGLRVKLAFNTPNTILEYLGLDPSGAPLSGCQPGGVVYPAGTIAQQLTASNNAVFVAAAPGGSYITGSGCMVAFKFRVETTLPVPGPGQTSTLTLLPECEIVDNTGTAFPALLSPPVSATVPYPVSGRVTYWKCSITDRGVGDTHLTLDQTTIPYTGSDVSDATTGLFSIPGFAGAGAKLTSARHDAATDFNLAADTDVKAAITATDVGLVLQHYGLPGTYPLDECGVDAAHCSPLLPQKIAANVDGNAVINSNDATVLLAIINYGMGVGTFPASYPIATNWYFTCTPKDLGVLTPPAISYDPIAVLLGDVNGSYRDTAKPRKTLPGTVLALPSVRTSAARVVVPVEIHGAEGLLGLQARIVYNASVLRFVGSDTPENAGRQAWVTGGDGVLALVAVGVPEKLNGDATVVNLRFERVDPAATRAISPLLVSSALADDQDVTVQNGLFTTPAVSATALPWSQLKSLYR